MATQAHMLTCGYARHSLHKSNCYVILSNTKSKRVCASHRLRPDSLIHHRSLPHSQCEFLCGPADVSSSLFPVLMSTFQTFKHECLSSSLIFLVGKKKPKIKRKQPHIFTASACARHRTSRLSSPQGTYHTIRQPSRGRPCPCICPR